MLTPVILTVPPPRADVCGADNWSLNVTDGKELHQGSYPHLDLIR